MQRKSVQEKFNELLDYFLANKDLWESKAKLTSVSDDAYYELIRMLMALKENHPIAKQIHDLIKQRGALNIPGPIPEIESVLDSVHMKEKQSNLAKHSVFNNESQAAIKESKVIVETKAEMPDKSKKAT